MILNDAGKMIQTEWEKLSQRFSNIELHEYVVMPNHFHGILEIFATGATDTVPENEPGHHPVGATLVVAPNVADDTVAENEPGEPQTGATTRVVGATLVVAPTDAENETGVQNETGANTDAPMGKTVGDMMAAFKSITTVEYIRGVKNSGWQPFNGKLWQRNYYEHIIRNERSYEIISSYIIDNPALWEDDKFYSIL